MDAYPDIPQCYGADGSKFDLGQEVDYAADGTPLIRLLHDGKWRDRIRHIKINASQRSTLEAFIAAHRGVAITLTMTDSGASRTVKIVEVGPFKPSGALKWDVDVTFAEV